MKRETLADFMTRVGGLKQPETEPGISEEKSRLRDAYGRFKQRKQAKSDAGQKLLA